MSQELKIAILVCSICRYMKTFAFLSVTLLLVIFSSCSSKDEQFCRCLELGKELNEASSKVLDDTLSEEQAKKVKDLKARQNKECSSYHQLDGTKLKELQKACAAN